MGRYILLFIYVDYFLYLIYDMIQKSRQNSKVFLDSVKVFLLLHIFYY